MIEWSVLAVELPFLLGMVLAQVLVQCGHCREVWRTSWPVLPAAFPSFVLGARFSGTQFFIILGLVTFGFMAVVFFLSFRNRYWRLMLVASGLIFPLLAVLTHTLIAF